MINLLALFASSPSRTEPTVVTLTDASISHVTPSPAAVALLTINTDGTVDKTEGVTVTQINPTTDWIIPNGLASSQYEVKWDVISGTSPNTKTTWPTEATYFDLSTVRTIGHTLGTTATVGGVLRISIRRNGGAIIDTADFTFNAQVTA